MKKLILILIVFFFSSLMANNKFDPGNSITITRSFGTVNPPSIISDDWEGTNFIKFNNGLYASRTTKWKHESQAKQISGFKYSGKVNILPDYNQWSIVYQDKDYDATFDTLWIEVDYKFRNLPKVVSMTEHTEIEKGYIWNVIEYYYILELSDKTSWKTQKQPTKRESLWKRGSMILKIGNAGHPCFINIDSVKKQELFIVREEHYLSDLELQSKEEY